MIEWNLILGIGCALVAFGVPVVGWFHEDNHIKNKDLGRR